MASDAPKARRRVLLRIYRRLLAAFGHAGWWPGESPFEVCVGAILVQNTAWTNVERTLDGLRRRGLLTFEALRRLPALAPRPAPPPFGHLPGEGRASARPPRVSRQPSTAAARRRMKDEEPARLREKLLAVRGVGEETADSIALYAAGHAALRRGRLHPPRLHPSRAPPRRRVVRRGPALLRGRAAARRRALQRLPRPDRPPRKGRLPPASPLLGLPPRGSVSRHPEGLR